MEKDMDKQKLAEMRRIIKLTLLKIGIRCDLVGFVYLAYAIEQVIQNPNLMKNLCGNLYVQISEKFGVSTPNRIERSIRHAITICGKLHNFDELNNLFKTKIYSKDNKPTAGELIKLLSDFYNLGLYKTQNYVI